MLSSADPPEMSVDMNRVNARSNKLRKEKREARVKAQLSGETDKPKKKRPVNDKKKKSLSSFRQRVCASPELTPATAY